MKLLNLFSILVLLLPPIPVYLTSAPVVIPVVPSQLPVLAKVHCVLLNSQITVLRSNAVADIRCWCSVCSINGTYTSQSPQGRRLHSRKLKENVGWKEAKACPLFFGGDLKDWLVLILVGQATVLFSPPFPWLANILVSTSLPWGLPFYWKRCCGQHCYPEEQKSTKMAFWASLQCQSQLLFFF